MGGTTRLSSTDCRSEEGVTVGLIDSLMAISRVLKPRLEAIVTSKYEGYSYGPLGEALMDLNADSDLRECVDFIKRYEEWKPFWRVVFGAPEVMPPSDPWKRGTVCALGDSRLCVDPDCRLHGSNWEEMRNNG